MLCKKENCCESVFRITDFQLTLLHCLLSQICEVHEWRCILAFHLGDLPLALEMAKKSSNAEEILRSSFMVVVQYLYDAMAHLEAAHEASKKKRKYINRALTILKKLKTLASHCPSNIHHFVCLVKAELAAVNGHFEKAMHLYNEAIEHATEEGFRYVRALALERRGKALLRSSGGSAELRKEAMDSIRQAREAYADWGAAAVAEHITKTYMFERLR